MYKLSELSEKTNQYSQLFNVTVCDGIQSLLLVQKENPTICIFSLHSIELDWTWSARSSCDVSYYTPLIGTTPPSIVRDSWLCLWYLNVFVVKYTHVCFCSSWCLLFSFGYTYCDYFHLYIISMIVSEYDF